MLNVDDICPRSACIALDQGVQYEFGRNAADSLLNLDRKRAIAVNDWILGSIKAWGVNPQQHRVRRAPSLVRDFDPGEPGVTGGYTDVTSSVSAITSSGYSIGSQLRKFNDSEKKRAHLLIGLTERFTGLDISLPIGKKNRNDIAALDNPPQTSLHPTVRTTVDYWGGEWISVANLDDGLRFTSDGVERPFTKSGRLSWTMPTDWRDYRYPDSEGGNFWLYTVRLSIQPYYRLQTDGAQSAGATMIDIDGGPDDAQIKDGEMLEIDGESYTAAADGSGAGFQLSITPGLESAVPDNTHVNLFSAHIERLAPAAAIAGNARASLISPIRESTLTAPAAYYALALLYNEADTVSHGKWREKAKDFMDMASQALDRAKLCIADELDTDGSGAVDIVDRSNTRVGFSELLRK